MIKIGITSNAEEVLKKFDEARKRLPMSLRDVVLWGALRIQSTARGKYFLSAGPRIGRVTGSRLHRRTGRLSRSINVRGPILTAGADGGVSAAEALTGTNVAYAAHWELGFHGRVQVKSHTRKVKEAFGRKLKEPTIAVVRPYSRQVDDDARPFLQPARDDEAPKILAETRRSIAETFKEGS